MIPVAVLGAAKASGLKVSLKASSVDRAAKVLGSVVNSALAGNLTAVRALSERRYIGLAKERAVWQSGYERVQQSRPDLVSAFEQHKTDVPAVDNSGPEAAASSALASPFSVSGTIAPIGAGLGAGASAWGQQVLDFLGFGSARQNDLAQQTGRAAGQQLERTFLLIAGLVAAVVVAVIVLRRR